MSKDVLIDDVQLDDFLKSLTIDQLEGEMLELAQVLGMDAFKRLIAIYGGCGSFFILSLCSLRNNARNQNLLREYHAGIKIKKLSKKYHLSERRVYDIIHAEKDFVRGKDT